MATIFLRTQAENGVATDDSLRAGLKRAFDEINVAGEEVVSAGA